MRQLCIIGPVIKTNSTRDIVARALGNNERSHLPRITMKYPIDPQDFAVHVIAQRILVLLAVAFYYETVINNDF